jgi:hypothetical protein
VNQPQLRCVVLRGLPKEVQEEVNKFLEATSPRIYRVLQSESGDHITLTVFYEIEPPRR